MITQTAGHSSKVIGRLAIMLLLLCPSAHGATLGVQKEGGACDPSGTPYYCTIQSALAAASNGDTVCVYAATSTGAYVEALTLTRQVSLVGKKSDGSDAWSAGLAGSLSGAPILTITDTSSFASQPVVTIGGASGISMQGLTIDSRGYPLTCTAITSTSYVSVTYCDFLMGGDAGTDCAIGVYDNNIPDNITVTFCRFVGQTTGTANWFAVMGGAGISSVTLSCNQITRTSSLLSLGSAGDVRNVLYNRNTFYGTAGAILLSDPLGVSAKDFANIRIIDNEFDATNEYAVVVSSNVGTDDAENGDWRSNLVVNNNAIKTLTSSSYPVVGFVSSTFNITPTYYMDAQLNWWGDLDGPADVSSRVDYSPWIAQAQEYRTGGDPAYWGTNDSITDALAQAGANDTVYVVAKGSPFAESVTVTTSLTLTGRTSAGADAWTTGTAGAASGAPILAITNTSFSNPLMLIRSTANNTTLKGFKINTGGAVAQQISCTTFGGAVSNVDISYCDYALDEGDKAIAVDYGNSISNLTATYNTFTGQNDNISNWFFVGENGSGGAVNNAILSNNSITNAMSTLQLNNSIKKIRYSNNTFNNSWDGGAIATKAGYLLIEEPNDDNPNIIQGITITHNTFNNGNPDTEPNEFGVLIANTVDLNETDWESNLAIHFNNFLQDDDNGGFPIAGFQTGSPDHASEITATKNYWSAAPNVSSNGMVSDNVKYNPWVRSGIDGGSYAVLGANTVDYITDTTNGIYLTVETGAGGATLLPTKYVGNPTSTSLTSAQGYFDLGIKSGTIDKITATFTYSGSDPSISNPAVWYNGSTWVSCSNQSLDASANAVTVYITDTSQITPTMSDVGTIHNITPSTFFALAFSTTTTTAPSTSTSSAAATTTSVTATSTTTSTGGGGGSTTTSTSTVPSTTTSALPDTASTTTIGVPQLSITPASLEFADNESAKQLSIANTGTGTLDWSIDDNATSYAETSGWVFSARPSTGQVMDTPDSVTLTVSRTLLSPGTYSAEIPVMSNAGDADIDVEMEVARSELPIMSVRPRLLLFLLDDIDNQTMTVRNLFSGTLLWELEDPIYHRGEGWLSFTPSSGSVRREADTVTVSVTRDAMSPGLYSATVPVRSNFNRRNITVVMLVQEGPDLQISPSLLFFGRNDENEKEVLLTNTGSGIANWTIDSDAIDYRGGDTPWVVSVSPLSGSTETLEEDTVTVTVSRDSLGFGLYRAIIPITSANGGDKKINVYLLVPFL